MADEEAGPPTRDESLWTKVVKLAAGAGTVTAALTTLLGNRAIAATSLGVAALALALALLRLTLVPAIGTRQRPVGAILAVVVLVGYGTAWSRPSTRDWLLQRDDRPVAAWRLSRLQFGELDQRHALTATVTSADDARVIERVSLVQYYSSGELNAGGIHNPCGGRDFDVYILSDAQLVEADGGSATYRFSQTEETDRAAMLSQAYGQWESLGDCYETLYIDTHPSLPISAGGQRTLAFAFDQELSLDRRYLYPIDGEPVGPQDVDINLWPLGDMPTEPDVVEYYEVFDIRLVGIAAHSDAGECATAAISLDPRSGATTDLDTDLRIGDVPLNDWLCTFTELPATDGASATPTP